MNYFAAAFLVLTFALAGCVSKSASNAKARAAFIAGQKQGAAMQASSSAVWVVGNVRTPIVPWTEELTLAKALIAADYLGGGNPSQIVLLRNGEPPRYVNPKQLLGGFDLPLIAGDRIEVRP